MKFRNLMLGAAAAAAVLALAGSANAAVIWANWTTTAPGAPGTASATLGPSNSVTYNGDLVGFNDDYPTWMPASTWTSPTVPNAPPQTGGILHLNGGNNHVNTLTFEHAVTNPLLAIWSLGQPGYPTTFDFGQITISVLSEGQNQEYPLSSLLTASNGLLTGTEGSGTVQLLGTFESISWTNPIFEDWYGFTVGIQAAVPEPATWAMMILGFAAVGAMAYGRHRRAVVAGNAA